MAIKPIAASAVLALLAGCGPISAQQEAEIDNLMVSKINHATAVCSKHGDNIFLRTACERDIVLQKASEVEHPDIDLLEEYYRLPFQARQMIEDGAADSDAAALYLIQERERVTSQMVSRSEQRASERRKRAAIGAAILASQPQPQRLQTNCNFYGNSMNCY